MHQLKTLHPKIVELKRRCGAFVVQTFAPDAIRAGAVGGSAADSLKSDFDKRIVGGYGTVWGQRDMFGTKFLKGCCAKSIQERGPNSPAKQKIFNSWCHNLYDPLALFETLVEDDYGLGFRTMPLDDVPNADRAIKQLRSGTVNGFSLGFNYLWDKMEYDESDDSIVCKEIELFEIATLAVAAVPGTYAIRGLETIDELDEDTEAFILSLPRKLSLEARQLFTRHKSLIDLEPLQQRGATLEGGQAGGVGLDMGYLLSNLKIEL